MHMSILFSCHVYVDIARPSQVLGGLFGARTPLGRALTGPVCAMSFGVCAAAALGPVPGAVLSTLAMPWGPWMVGTCGNHLT